MLVYDKEEPVTDNLITWVLDENSFVPAAKLVGDKSYSILTDHLGTPCEAYDEEGEKVWARELDLYGNAIAGDSSFIPFLYQGQYYDEEIGLAYNRFRYYNPETGAYISQDPIGLAGGNPTLYGYVKDSNWWVDVFGLDFDKPEGKQIKGTAYRYEDKDRLETTWQAHKWNVNSNHRYTKEGVGGVYGGTSAETAFKEITHYLVDMNRRVLVTKDFELNNVLDLTDSKVRSQLGVSFDDITGDSYDFTHKIGDFAIENGYDGILAPSARNMGGSNIIIFGGL